MRFGAALLSAAWVLATRLVPGRTTDRSELPTIDREPMELGVPLYAPPLKQDQTRCSLVEVPKEYKRVRVLAVAVALTGNPLLAGGWDGVIPGEEPDGNAGYEILDKTMDREGDMYYLCYRTFSEEGCDLMLTPLVVQPDEEDLPLIDIRQTYPMIWPLVTRNGKPERVRFRLYTERADLHVAALPLDYGDTKVTTFNSPDCSGTPLESSVVEGPGVFTVPRDQHSHELLQELCFEAVGNGVLSLTVTGGDESVKGPPHVAPGVPAVVQLEPIDDRCRQVSISMNKNVNATITATAEDGSPLTLSACLMEYFGPSCKTQFENHFHGRSVPGDVGSVLMVSGSEIAHEEKSDEGARIYQTEGGRARLNVSVCRKGQWSIGADGKEVPTLVWLDAVTDRSVVNLADGLPYSTVVAAHTPGEAKAHFRDFRFLVPGGEDKPKEITITASSPGKACVAADMHRFPHDPKAYRWTSREQNTSEPEIRLTTDITLRSAEVHYVKCRFPCFIYITALAWTNNRPDLDTDLEVIVTMEEKKPILLRKDAPLEQHLAQNETQLFIYEISDMQQATVFTLSQMEGTPTLTTCMSPACTRKFSNAGDLFFVYPGDNPFWGTLMHRAYVQHLTFPVIYLQVTSGSMPATFTLVGRSVGDAEILRNGEAAHGAVEAGGYDVYKFYVGQEEVDKAKKTNEALEVTIELLPVMGKAGLYVSCATEQPTRKEYDWKSDVMGENSIFFTSASPKFKAGWIHIGIPGKFRAVYGIRVSWGNATIQLQDGFEELGKLVGKEVRTYAFAIEDLKTDQPVAIRVMALVGAVSLCVKRYTDEERQDKQATTVCDYKAKAEPMYRAKHMNLALAALDIPPDAVRKGGRFVLLLQGLTPMNVFSLRATYDAPVTLAEGHDVMEALTPLSLKRTYKAFVPPVKNAALWVQAIDPEGNLAGMLLKVRGKIEKDDNGCGDKHKDKGNRTLSFQNRSDDKTPSSVMHLDMDLKGLTSFGELAPVEIEVEAVRPVNFTMHLFTPEDDVEDPNEPSYERRQHRMIEAAIKAGETTDVVPTAQQQLIPGELMSELFTEDDIQTSYEFAIDTRASDGNWHLHVRECLGHITVNLPHVDETWTKGDTDMLLPAPKERNSGSITADGVVLVKPTSPASHREPVKYELTLMEPGTENLSPILLPAKPTLTQDSQHGKFEFNSAHVNRTLLKEMIGSATDAELFYTLVAVPAYDNMANFNSPCGLSEAVKRPHTLSVKLRQDKTIGKKRLSAELPEVTGGSFIVNVMVTLVSDTGKTLASISYTPYYLNVTAPFRTRAESQLFREADTPPKMVLAVLMMGCMVCCWCMTSNNSPCGGSSKGSIGLKAMDGDDYELQDSFEGTSTSLLSSRAGDYVPPNV